MGNFNFGYSSCCGAEALKTIPWTRFGRNGKIMASGRMYTRDILPSMQKSELIARETMRQSHAAHVLYGLKIYDRYDEIEAVQFYNWEMDEEEFEQYATKCRSGIVYALHRR